MDQETLKSLVRYEPATGKLFWKERTAKFAKSKRMADSWNSRWAGKEVGTDNGNGYLVTNVLGKKYYVHRLVWLLNFGEWPEHIDHENGQTKDNRLTNLRSVTNATNRKNCALSKTNRSGIVGVTWKSGRDCWRVNITYKRKQIFLGHTKDLDEARRIREAANIKYGFHPNHGREVNGV
jgi:hypothetical protein